MFDILGASDLLLIASLAIIVVLGVRRYRRGRADVRSREMPLLVYPYQPPYQADGEAAAPGSDPSHESPERSVPSIGAASSEPRSAQEDAAGVPMITIEDEHDLAALSRPARSAEVAPRPGTGPSRLPAGPRRSPFLHRSNGTGRVANGGGPEIAAPNPSPDLQPVRGRGYVAEEVTLQLLPGRLDVLVGPDQGLQIRFVKQNRAEPTEYTLGRAPAVDFEHIQVRGVTVSRIHAAMRYDGGRWSLINRSSTNPTRVGERELTRPGDAEVLSDGDRVELGEVVLQFHAGVR